MTQADLLELAKQGHPSAIAQLINQSLQPNGITATTSLNDGCLQVMLEAELVPKQQVLAKFIYQGALNLNPDSITSLIVSGKKFSHATPVWSQTFDLVNPSAIASPPENIPRGIDSDRSPASSGKKNISSQSKSRVRKSGLRNREEAIVAEPLSPAEECEQRLYEIGGFPTKGKLSVSYYYAIPKLARAALSLVQSSNQILDAIAVRYRGELAALLLTDKYLACFLFPDFSQEAKKSFVLIFEQIHKVTISPHGLIVYPKKYPLIKLYFQRKRCGQKFIKDKLPNFVFIEKRRGISFDTYELTLNMFGVFVFIIALGCNLLTIFFIVQHILTQLIGFGI